MPEVAELCEHPGAQDGPQSGLAEVDLSVRLLTKTGLDWSFQGGDLRPRQPSRPVRLGCLGQQLQDVGGREVLVGLKRGREELPQAGAQP